MVSFVLFSSIPCEGQYNRNMLLTSFSSSDSYHDKMRQHTQDTKTYTKLKRDFCLLLPFTHTHKEGALYHIIYISNHEVCVHSSNVERAVQPFRPIITHAKGTNRSFIRYQDQKRNFFDQSQAHTITYHYNYIYIYIDILCFSTPITKKGFHSAKIWLDFKAHNVYTSNTLCPLFVEIMYCTLSPHPP
jgi:hypothetical protein